MLVRDLPAEFSEEAVDLWRRTGLVRPWNDAHADLERAVLGASSAVLAAFDDDASLVGTSMVGNDGHRGWVYYLAVAPDHQRQGVGRALMQASEAWLVERDVPKLNLMVRRGNEAVLAFYEALGYVDGAVVVLGKFLARDESGGRTEAMGR